MKAFTALFVLLLCGCASREASSPGAVRLRFVPASDSAGARAASWSALHPAPGKDSGALMAMAHAGIGGTFPVYEEGGPILFRVTLLEGDDDRLLVEIRSDDGSQRIDLARDQSVPFRVGGSRYDLAYPSVQVSAAAEPTTTRAMILVHRFSAATE